jgi:hypothetical protein
MKLKEILQQVLRLSQIDERQGAGNLVAVASNILPIATKQKAC